ncbi:hypothetical protein D3C84_809300 [compost metagenome]
MATGLYLENGGKCVLKNGSIESSDVGICVKDSDLTLENVDFKNISTAVKGSGETPIDARNVTHAEMHWDSNSTPIEIVRRFANAYV